MTNTTPTVRVIAPEEECDIDVPTLRRLADVAEMIGHPVTTNCPKGFAREFTLDEVSYDEGAIKVRGNHDGDTIRIALCSTCRISVIMDLGVVTA